MYKKTHTERVIYDQINQSLPPARVTWIQYNYILYFGFGGSNGAFSAHFRAHSGIAGQVDCKAMKIQVLPAS